MTLLLKGFADSDGRDYGAYARIHTKKTKDISFHHQSWFYIGDFLSYILGFKIFCRVKISLE